VPAIAWYVSPLTKPTKLAVKFGLGPPKTLLWLLTVIVSADRDCAETVKVPLTCVIE